LSPGTDAPGRLLYCVTVGPVVDRAVDRASSVLFALAHTTIIGIPWLVFFGMGMLYALLRWRSNSTATAALMHATYNAVIAYAILSH